MKKDGCKGCNARDKLNEILSEAFDAQDSQIRMQGEEIERLMKELEKRVARMEEQSCRMT